MKVRHKKTILLELERYPNNCGECPAFKQVPYQCHNERGLEANCEFGYMSGDMRDFSGRTLYTYCALKFNKNVTLMGENKK